MIQTLLTAMRALAFPTIRWEYHVADSFLSDAQTLESELNKLGKTGWEMIDAQARGVGVPGRRFIFRRPVLRSGVDSEA